MTTDSDKRKAVLTAIDKAAKNGTDMLDELLIQGFKIVDYKNSLFNTKELVKRFNSETSLNILRKDRRDEYKYRRYCVAWFANRYSLENKSQIAKEMGYNHSTLNHLLPTVSNLLVTKDIAFMPYYNEAKVIIETYFPKIKLIHERP